MAHPSQTTDRKNKHTCRPHRESHCQRSQWNPSPVVSSPQTRIPRGPGGGYLRVRAILATGNDSARQGEGKKRGRRRESAISMGTRGAVLLSLVPLGSRSNNCSDSQSYKAPGFPPFWTVDGHHSPSFFSILPSSIDYCRLELSSFLYPSFYSIGAGLYHHGLSFSPFLAGAHVQQLQHQHCQPADPPSPISPAVGNDGQLVADEFVFAFDIDGVLVRGGRALPEAIEAMKVLNGENEFGIRV